MKKTIFKIMSLAVTIALLASLIVVATPAGALTIVSVDASNGTISASGVTYEIGFTGSLNLVGGTDWITFIFPTSFDLDDVDMGDIYFDPGDGGWDSITAWDNSG